jgi:hypothetical protein
LTTEDKQFSKRTAQHKNSIKNMTIQFFRIKIFDQIIFSTFPRRKFCPGALKMCRVHTERFFYLCGHSQWIEIRGDALCGNCDKANGYRMQLWNNHLCANCRPPDEEDPEEDGPMPQTEAEEELGWKNL